MADTISPVEYTQITISGTPKDLHDLHACLEKTIGHSIGKSTKFEKLALDLITDRWGPLYALNEFDETILTLQDNISDIEKQIKDIYAQHKDATKSKKTLDEKFFLLPLSAQEKITELNNVVAEIQSEIIDTRKLKSDYESSPISGALETQGSVKSFLEEFRSLLHQNTFSNENYYNTDAVSALSLTYGIDTRKSAWLTDALENLASYLKSKEEMTLDVPKDEDALAKVKTTIAQFQNEGKLRRVGSRLNALQDVTRKDVTFSLVMDSRYVGMGGGKDVSLYEREKLANISGLIEELAYTYKKGKQVIVDQLRAEILRKIPGEELQDYTLLKEKLEEITQLISLPNTSRELKRQIVALDKEFQIAVPYLETVAAQIKNAGLDDFLTFNVKEKKAQTVTFEFAALCGDSKKDKEITDFLSAAFKELYANENCYRIESNVYMPKINNTDWSKLPESEKDKNRSKLSPIQLLADQFSKTYLTLSISGKDEKSVTDFVEYLQKKARRNRDEMGKPKAAELKISEVLKPDGISEKVVSAIVRLDRFAHNEVPAGLLEAFRQAHKNENILSCYPLVPRGGKDSFIKVALLEAAKYPNEKTYCFNPTNYHILFDTETTGLLKGDLKYASGNGEGEKGALASITARDSNGVSVLYDSKKDTFVEELYCNSDIPYSIYVEKKVTGLNDDFLIQNGYSMEDVAAMIYSSFEEGKKRHASEKFPTGTDDEIKTILVAHNAIFDKTILKETGLPYYLYTFYDTMEGYRSALIKTVGDYPKGEKLTDALAAFGAKPIRQTEHGFHTADEDTRALKTVFLSVKAALDYFDYGNAISRHDFEANKTMAMTCLAEEIKSLWDRGSAMFGGSDQFLNKIKDQFTVSDIEQYMPLISSGLLDPTSKYNEADYRANMHEKNIGDFFELHVLRNKLLCSQIDSFPHPDKTIENNGIVIPSISSTFEPKGLWSGFDRDEYASMKKDAEKGRLFPEKKLERYIEENFSEPKKDEPEVDR